MSKNKYKSFDLLNKFSHKNELNSKNIPKIFIGAQETPVILFTSEVHSIRLHYIGGDENQYILCNGKPKKKCVVCQCGKKVVEKLLLPVFAIERRDLAWLPLSPELRPDELLPKLLAVMANNPISVVFVSKRDGVYRVETGVVPKGYSKKIQKIQERMEQSPVDPTLAYKKIDNRDLAEIPELALILQMKGIEFGDKEADE